MRRYIIPLIFGLGGFAVLVYLGLWQLERLAWKEGILAEIETRIAAPVVDLPNKLDVEKDRYLPVRVSGRTTGETFFTVSTNADAGPGYRVISAFVTDGGRRIMVDEGFIRTSEMDAEFPPVDMSVTGNLHWPDEADDFTPPPEIESGIWYARDVARMSEALNTEPALVIARVVTGADARATPMPVTTTGIPNSHLGYAVQWFGLAAVWAGMTLFLLWRIRQRTN